MSCFVVFFVFVSNLYNDVGKDKKFTVQKKKKTPIIIDDIIITMYL